MNLRAKFENSTVLTGDAMDEEEVLMQCQKHNGEHSLARSLCLKGLNVSCFELCADLYCTCRREIWSEKLCSGNSRLSLRDARKKKRNKKYVRTAKQNHGTSLLQWGVREREPQLRLAGRPT
jgi:hypothetical protein